MRDSSLEDFLDGSENSQTDPTASESEGETDETVESADESVNATKQSGSFNESLEPAITTYAWTAGGAECDECSSTVERRWRDGEKLVCADCKNW